MWGKHVTEAEVEFVSPGLLAELESKGVELSNNVGTIIIEGYLGDIADAISNRARAEVIDYFEQFGLPDEVAYARGEFGV